MGLIWHITGHLEDESFQAINYTVANNETCNNQKHTKNIEKNVNIS